MGEFERRIAKLNPQQKIAVQTIDGPVMVIAGPGTGKTELLSLRVANIIKQTDALPTNILCLTFTDNAARNMRERLEEVIGQRAYHIGIHTFHSFGSDIINQYPDSFTERRMLQQVDELGRYELLRDIFETLPHGNPLSAKVGDEFIMLKSTLEAISWLKQNALTPPELHAIIKANERFFAATADSIAAAFSATPSAKQLSTYQKLLQEFEVLAAKKQIFGFPDYATKCAAEFRRAVEAVDPNGRYATAITEWRKNWCIKDTEGRHVLKDAGRNVRKMHALANVYQQLIDSMARQGLYDFDDMIVETVHALENDEELKLNLQERYQYILVDEFQDTNKAQLRMLTSLGDNPIFENRPNIMVVGDDDQAIYAFQGAEVSNMVLFSKLYTNPALVTLQKNYRSSKEILRASYTVAEQITDRLESILNDTHKELSANTNYSDQLTTHTSFQSELSQYEWIATQIAKIINDGEQPEQIAVIAPRHRYLERLVPYLANHNLPVAYERRENILDAPIVNQLITMTKLVVAISNDQHVETDALFGQVLRYEFWQLQPETIMSISITCYDKHSHWLPVLLKHSDSRIVRIAQWFVGLAQKVTTEPMEYIIDELVGAEATGADTEYNDELAKRAKTRQFTSPLKEYYFSNQQYEANTDTYLSLLGQLSTLRQRLRLWKPNQMLRAEDFVTFADLHKQAHLKIIDTNPHTQTTNAVQVMTAYKAKGLEFGTVFVINLQDEIWGPTARKGSSNITLPKNLPVAPTGDNDNDKLRLLFVALTRAKHHLYLTSYSHTLDNKPSPGLSFISHQGDEPDPDSEVFRPTPIDIPTSTKSVEILATDWAYRFRQVIADKPTLFQPILANYKLSVTHLNNFVDVASAGPGYFFMHNLLRFPEAPTPSAAYGDAVHKTLQWVYAEFRLHGALPRKSLVDSFFTDMLSRKHLKPSDYKRLNARGHLALNRYLKERAQTFSPNDLIERGFNNEGVLINEARLSGKIDKLHFIRENVLEVIDFKTGKPAMNWQGKDEYEKIKLHKYRQQLLFYKLLVERSASYNKRFTVRSGALEFIEPADNDQLVQNLNLEFDESELETFKKLIEAVWQHIVSLNFPDTAGYKASLVGLKQFENDLIEGTI